ncbi:MAG: sugar ABC transporter ATP-binding protein [Ideonella sp. MAG2]|nr:MAG: sugar ABC transporter ATP-binding protein [Ideonella sp. MAG2]
MAYTMTTVHIDQLRKLYDTQVAVDQTTLTLPSGKFVVFLGPSGCGKTTTLNCIAGFEEVSSGRILFDDVDVTTLAPHERNVAMVFQSALLYPHLSALRNVEMSLVHSALDATEKAKRIGRVIEMLRIEPLMHKRPGQLSGGERQRVAIAKATVRQPSVFLMDEPFSALDAALRQSLRTDLVHLQRQLGVTTVFVTHDQVEAMTMGDSIVVMDRARVQQVGTPSEIYEQPANRFVAGFIGSPPMNFFKGELHGSGSGLELRTAHGVFTLPDRLCQRAHSFAPAGKPVYLGVRPQHLRLTGASDTGPVARATVYGVERLGKENVIILKAGEDTLRLLGDPDLQPALGSTVTVALDLSRAFLFDH